MRLVLPLLLTACLLFPASAAFLTHQSPTRTFVSHRESSFQCSSSRYNPEEEEEDDDDNEEIDADSLGDWRAFRRNLAGRMTNAADEEPTSVANKISTENEKVLRTQNQVLANEYKTGAWAHETSMVCIHLLECIC